MISGLLNTWIYRKKMKTILRIPVTLFPIVDDDRDITILSEEHVTDWTNVKHNCIILLLLLVVVFLACCGLCFVGFDSEMALLWHYIAGQTKTVL